MNTESAFPIPNSGEPGSYPPEPGMTLRDYFAGKAMQAMLSNSNSIASIEAAAIKAKQSPTIRTAEQSYLMADAMLKHREGK